ncbi:hypothetical protein CD351_00615 [Erythrobacter sp. KY5]|uniref:c-type cytochrome n=1 Tax=Erythrobacter sp. KY5 TaxID=2011159 RepID=UPI000DBF010F|nr:c-type cytochrome [Erythrobacter sp. KY5]AWW72924.1 hypothetical protein CD351_00615 [Erythrobacter sp. KY5]
MRMVALSISAIAAMSLSACGSAEPEGPEEQIIVRDRGAPDVLAADTGSPMQTGMIAAGKTVFEANCAICHTVDAGTTSGIGPGLNGVVGRSAASLDDFAYSSAMQASGITWTTSEIDAYIANPTAKLPGTSMAGVMVTDAQDRSAITAYLESLGSD